MSFTSRLIGSVFLGLVLFSGSVWAAATTTTIVQGAVKGPDGKPIAGAVVSIQPKDAKAVTATVKTDQQGRYAIKNLPAAAYTVTVNAVGMATTAAENVKSRTEGAVRVDFALKKQGAYVQGVAPTKKKTAKHMVWVPSNTGTNIGGRWVEVDDGGSASNTSDVANLKRVGGGAVRSAQSNAGAEMRGN